MSLKSFDKFCEKMITGEPSSEKPIYDERQNIVRSRLIIEALTIYGAASIIDAALNELVYMWCESVFAQLVLIAALCLMWYLIRCAAKGALFGVNGTYFAKITGCGWVGMGVFFALYFAFGDDVSVVTDGALSGDIVFVISYVLLALCGIFQIIMARREDKRRKENQTNFQ